MIFFFITKKKLEKINKGKDYTLKNERPISKIAPPQLAPNLASQQNCKTTRPLATVTLSFSAVPRRSAVATHHLATANTALLHL